MSSGQHWNGKIEKGGQGARPRTYPRGWPVAPATHVVQSIAKLVHQRDRANNCTVHARHRELSNQISRELRRWLDKILTEDVRATRAPVCALSAIKVPGGTLEAVMIRYLSLKKAVLEFKVSDKELVQLTSDGEFPLCEWGGTFYYASTDLEKKFRWRKSRGERAREVSYVLVNFQSPVRH